MKHMVCLQVILRVRNKRQIFEGLCALALCFTCCSSEIFCQSDTSRQVVEKGRYKNNLEKNISSKSILGSSGCLLTPSLLLVKTAFVPISKLAPCWPQNVSWHLQLQGSSEPSSGERMFLFPAYVLWFIG